MGDVLVLCCGNPGRLDDGLGPAFGDYLEKLALTRVDVEIDYQLNPEHAVSVAEHSMTLVVDAALSGPGPFFLRALQPRPTLDFSSHTVSPEGLLALARELSGKAPECYTLAIRGYEFDHFGEYLSPAARSNLEAALWFVVPALVRGDFSRRARWLLEQRHGSVSPCREERLWRAPSA